MGLENCQIYFDNQQVIYIPGQVLSGRVEFNFNSTKRVRGIYILLKGESSVHWSERRSKNTVHYKGSEEYFRHKYYVLGGPNNDAIDLVAGQYEYQFSYTLPTVLPTSFEGTYGYVRYTVKATLDRPWKFDQSIKAAFSVLAFLDLNRSPHFRESVTLSMEKTFGFCCCKSGPLIGKVMVPCTGFVPGQTIPVSGEINNEAGVELQGVVFKLQKLVSYHAQTPRRKTKIDAVDVTETVVGHGLTKFSASIAVPSVPPSNLEDCNIIDVIYILKVNVVVKGCHRNMVGELSLTIGTIPLNNLVPMEMSTASAPSSTTSKLTGWAPGLSGSQTSVYDISLPSYEESKFRTDSILDSNDSEYTKFNQNYAPLYPVYNFHTTPSAPLETTMKPVLS